MTKETAIALLNNLRAFAEDDDEPAIDMAIKALSAGTIKFDFNKYRPSVRNKVNDGTPSAEAVSRESYINAVGYVEWLEKLIVDSETFEWVCENTDREWCEKNCDYSSIQTECLRHMYRKNCKDYELATEQMEHDAMYEPTYNSEDGSM